MILHLTNDFSGSTVYKNLVGELDVLGLSQIIYNPVREVGRIGKNKINLEVEDSEIFYSNILNRFTDRVFYRKKIQKIVKDLERKVDLKKIKIIHAHTWYSDGGVAYLLHKKYKIPYIITVRTTDINVFYKYFLHQRAFGKLILENAKNIILVNNIFKNNILKIDRGSEEKIIVIPNGVDPFWLTNISFKKEKLSDNFKILYVGTFIPRKRILETLKAVIEINNDIHQAVKIHLSIVGYGEGKYSKKIISIIKKYSDHISYYGKITDKDALVKVYRENDVFVMPSKIETFGLVYIEALLQGLPVLYTHNEGIDGFYTEKIGEKVTLGNVEEIKQKLLIMINDYNTYIIPTEKLIDNHDWSKIALLFKEIYKA